MKIQLKDGQWLSQMFPILQYPDDREGVVYLLPGVKYRIESLTGRHLMAGCNSVVSIRLVGKNV